VLQRWNDSLVGRTTRAARKRPSGLWLVVAMWVLLGVQALLPAIHGAEHRPRGPQSVVALGCSDLPADHDAGQPTPVDDGDHSDHRDCDVCKLLLLTKTIGGVAIEPAAIRLPELPGSVTGIDSERACLARVEHAIGARGPPLV